MLKFLGKKKRRGFFAGLSGGVRAMNAMRFSGREASLEGKSREELEAEILFLRKKLEIETAGRTNAEKALRGRFLAETAGVGTFSSLGVMRTMFNTRFGTPRQGALATRSRGMLQLDDKVVGKESLTGLEGFSHAWVIFVFHENTNLHKKSVDPDRPKLKKKALAYVKPPQADGQKLGVFATRTPHRPNPIGLTMVQIDSVDTSKGIVRFRGIDIVDGTPVLDIKPYVPLDQPEEFESPEWLVNPKFNAVEIKFTPETKQRLLHFCAEGNSRWFGNEEGEDLITCIEELVSLDPRGVIHGRGKYNDEKDAEEPGKFDHLHRQEFLVDIDAFKLRFRPHATERAIEVFSAELLTLGKTDGS